MANISAETLLKIRNLYKKNAGLGKQAAQYFAQARSETGSKYYAPYATGKSNYTELTDFFGVDNFDDAFFTQNAGLRSYYNLNANGTPQAPTRKSSQEEVSAYMYYQAAKADEYTKKLEDQWRSLQKELYNRATLNPALDDDTILAGIDWTKYDALQEYEQDINARTVPALTRPVAYSGDYLKAVLYNVRRGKPVGSTNYDYLPDLADYYDNQAAKAAQTSAAKATVQPQKQAAAQGTTQTPATPPAANVPIATAAPQNVPAQTPDGTSFIQYPGLLPSDMVPVAIPEITGNNTLPFGEPPIINITPGQANTKPPATVTPSPTPAPVATADLTPAPSVTPKPMSTYFPWIKPSQAPTSTPSATPGPTVTPGPTATPDQTAAASQPPAATPDAAQSSTPPVTNVAPGSNFGIPKVDETILPEGFDQVPYLPYYYGWGNIDLNHRAVLTNDDGSFSTEESISFWDDKEKKEILIPTIIDGKRVSEKQAIARYRSTGQYLGKFDTPEEADAYAQNLHLRQEQYYTSGNAGQNTVYDTKSVSVSASGGKNKTTVKLYYWDAATQKKTVINKYLGAKKATDKEVAEFLNLHNAKISGDYLYSEYIRYEELWNKFGSALLKDLTTNNNGYTSVFRLYPGDGNDERQEYADLEYLSDNGYSYTEYTPRQQELQKKYGQTGAGSSSKKLNPAGVLASGGAVSDVGFQNSAKSLEQRNQEWLEKYLALAKDEYVSKKSSMTLPGDDELAAFARDATALGMSVEEYLSMISGPAETTDGVPDWVTEMDKWAARKGNPELTTRMRDMYIVLQDYLSGVPMEQLSDAEQEAVWEFDKTHEGLLGGYTRSYGPGAYASGKTVVYDKRKTLGETAYNALVAAESPLMDKELSAALMVAIADDMDAAFGKYAPVYMGDGAMVQTPGGKMQGVSTVLDQYYADHPDRKAAIDAFTEEQKRREAEAKILAEKQQKEETYRKQQIIMSAIDADANGKALTQEQTDVLEEVKSVSITAEDRKDASYAAFETSIYEDVGMSAVGDPFYESDLTMAMYRMHAVDDVLDTDARLAKAVGLTLGEYYERFPEMRKTAEDMVKTGKSIVDKKWNPESMSDLLQFMYGLNASDLSEKAGVGLGTALAKGAESGAAQFGEGFAHFWHLYVTYPESEEKTKAMNRAAYSGPSGREEARRDFDAAIEGIKDPVQKEIWRLASRSVTDVLDLPFNFADSDTLNAMYSMQTSLTDIASFMQAHATDAERAAFEIAAGVTQNGLSMAAATAVTYVTKNPQAGTFVAFGLPEAANTAQMGLDAGWSIDASKALGMGSAIFTTAMESAQFENLTEGGMFKSAFTAARSAVAKNGAGAVKRFLGKMWAGTAYVATRIANASWDEMKQEFVENVCGDAYKNLFGVQSKHVLDLLSDATKAAAMAGVTAPFLAVQGDFMSVFTKPKGSVEQAGKFDNQSGAAGPDAPAVVNPPVSQERQNARLPERITSDPNAPRVFREAAAEEAEASMQDIEAAVSDAMQSAADPTQETGENVSSAVGQIVNKFGQSVVDSVKQAVSETYRSVMETFSPENMEGVIAQISDAANAALQAAVEKQAVAQDVSQREAIDQKGALSQEERGLLAQLQQKQAMERDVSARESVDETGVMSEADRSMLEQLQQRDAINRDAAQREAIDQTGTSNGAVDAYRENAAMERDVSARETIDQTPVANEALAQTQERETANREAAAREAIDEASGAENAGNDTLAKITEENQEKRAAEKAEIVRQGVTAYLEKLAANIKETGGAALKEIVDAVTAGKVVQELAKTDWSKVIDKEALQAAKEAKKAAQDQAVQANKTLESAQSQYVDAVNAGSISPEDHKALLDNLNNAKTFAQNAGKALKEAGAKLGALNTAANKAFTDFLAAAREKAAKAAQAEVMNDGQTVDETAKNGNQGISETGAQEEPSPADEGMLNQPTDEAVAPALEDKEPSDSASTAQETPGQGGEADGNVQEPSQKTGLYGPADGLKTQTAKTEAVEQAETSTAQAVAQTKALSPKEIFGNLAEKLGITGLLADRNFGRRSKRTRGYFRVTQESIHTREESNLGVAFHEIGHYIDKGSRLSDSAEISGLVDRLLNSGTTNLLAYPANLHNTEAIAEYARIWMTNPAQAAALGGTFMQEFEAALEKRGLMGYFKEARTQVQLWQNATVADKIGAMVKDRKKTKTKINADWLITKLTNFDHPGKMVDDAVKASGRKVSSSTSLRTLVQQSSYFNDTASSMIDTSLTSPTGEVIGPSFVEAIQGKDGNRITAENEKLFSSYLLAKHAIDRAAESKIVFPFDTQQFVQETEAAHPEFLKAANGMRAWWRQFIQAWYVDTGFIPQNTFDEWNKTYPYYVPTYRVMEEQASSGTRRGASDQYAHVKSAKGSDRNIYNPIDSMIRDVERVVNTVGRNNIGRAFVHAVANHDGLGWIATPVQSKQSKMSSIFAQVDELLAEPDDSADVWEQVHDLMGMLTRVAVSDNSAQNIITVLMEDGTPQSWQVHDSLIYDMITELGGNDGAKTWLDSAAIVTRSISQLATGSNPLFSIPNLLRDLPQAVTTGSFASNIGTGTAKWLAAAYEYAAASSETYKMYQAMGASNTRYQVIDKKSLRAQKNLLFPGYNWQSGTGNAIAALGEKAFQTVTFEEFNRFIENVSRFTEFRYGGYDLSTPEGRLSAAQAAHNVTVNFRMHGSSPVVQSLAKVMPFINPAVQGLVKTASMFTADQRGRLPARAAKIAFHALLAGALSGALMLMHGTDEDKEAYGYLPDYIKLNYVVFPTGDKKYPFGRIPIPQDITFKALYGLGLYAAGEIGNAPDGFTENVGTVAFNLLKEANPVSSTFISPVLDVWNNTTWYGSPIVSGRLENYPTALQYDEKTADAFRSVSNLSNALGIQVSPKGWEYLFKQYTGFFGQVVIPAISKDPITGETGGLSAVWDAVLRRFTVNPAYTNDVTSAMYDNAKRLESNIAAWNSTGILADFNPSLSPEQAKEGARQAKALLSAKGEIGMAKDTISNLYDELDAVISSNMPAEQINAAASRIQMDIVRTAQGANEAYAAFAEKYLGKSMVSVMTGQFATTDKPTALNTMPALYDNDQDKQYMQTYRSLYEKFSVDYFIPGEPSYNWSDGGVKLDIPDDIKPKIAETYRMELEYQTNLVSGWDGMTLEQAREKAEYVRDKAAAAAKRRAISLLQGGK